MLTPRTPGRADLAARRSPQPEQLLLLGRELFLGEDALLPQLVQLLDLLDRIDRSLPGASARSCTPS